jgi:hypothetical protein
MAALHSPGVADDQAGHPVHLLNGRIGVGLGKQDDEQRGEILDRHEISNVRLSFFAGQPDSLVHAGTSSGRISARLTSRKWRQDRVLPSSDSTTVGHPSPSVSASTAYRSNATTPAIVVGRMLTRAQAASVSSSSLRIKAFNLDPPWIVRWHDDFFPRADTGETLLDRQFAIQFRMPPYNGLECNAGDLMGFDRFQDQVSDSLSGSSRHRQRKPRPEGSAPSGRRSGLGEKFSARRRV